MSAKRRSRAARWKPYRSGLEAAIAVGLTKAKVKFEYEKLKVPFTQPEQQRVYIPDFVLKKGKKVLCVIEAKGKLDSDGRKKLLWVKEQNPNLNLKILFQRANNKIRKGSKVTYADWATKHGFEYADFEKGGIPAKWTR